MDINQQAQQASERLKAALAESDRIAAEAKAEEEKARAAQKAQEDSAKAVDSYLKERAVYALKNGASEVKVNRAYVGDSVERSLDLAAQAIVNPLYGMARLNGYYSFHGENYADFKTVTRAVSDYLGLEIDQRHLSGLLYESLSEDLSQPALRRAAIRKVLKDSGPDMPDNLTLEDQFRLQAILGTL